ncbi:hypothetical protein C8R42DRAFT_38168 [Lentinula raphanica]|nr:hypothetical protein C8R42DRAFT_38168 [Lentinula raphanica]
MLIRMLAAPGVHSRTMLARHIHHAICSFLAFVFVAVFAEVPDWTCSPPPLGHIGLPRALFEAVFFPRGSCLTNLHGMKQEALSRKGAIIGLVSTRDLCYELQCWSALLHVPWDHISMLERCSVRFQV